MSPEINSFEFGDFLLDTREKVLLRNGKPLPVTPKVFQMLLVLVENHGRIVEKERLMQTVWAGSFVEESNLTFTMRQLRKILGDDKNNPRFIETIPKRGYRFIAETKENNGQPDVFPEKDSAESLFPASTFPRPRKDESPAMVEPARHYALWSSIILVLVFGFTTYYWWLGAKKPDGQLKFQRLTANGNTKLAAISPDSKFITYVIDKEQQQSLWVKNIPTGSELQLVPSAENTALGSLKFSPDGNNIYFAAKGTLNRIPVLGGTPKKVLENYGGSSQNNAVTFSPDGKQFAFIRFSAEGGESAAVIVADADGSGERILASSKRPAIFLRSPAWSPDGNVIACAAMNPNGGQEVVTVRVADGTVSSVPSPPWSIVLQTAWQPDGKGLVVTASKGADSVVSQIWRLSYPDGEARILVGDFNNYQSISLTTDGRTLAAVRLEQVAHIWNLPGEDASQARQLTSGFGKYDGIYSLNWLPEGRIVYETKLDGKGEIWTIDPNGDDPKQIATQAEAAGISPDGKLLIFQSGDKEGIGLFRLNIADGERVRLTKGTDVWAAVSPDGKWVVFTRYGDRVALWKVPIEGGEAVKLTDFSGYPVAPAVSPDGKLIAFFIGGSGKMNFPAISLIPFNGGEVTQRFEPPVQIAPGYEKPNLQWTNDGQAINFMVFRNGVSNIWRQPIDGSAPFQVTNFQNGRIFNFAYSPDGKQLALSKGTFERDVILITNLPE